MIDGDRAYGSQRVFELCEKETKKLSVAPSVYQVVSLNVESFA